MEISRRDFLRVSGATMGVMLFPSFLKDAKAESYARMLKTKEGTESTTICPYCACGCGIIVTARKWGNKVINTEGNPDHPINEGSLCSKGSALYQIANSDKRLKFVWWRPPNGKRWITIPWFLALIMMAQRIKRTREANFTTEDLSSGRTVNRTEAIAAIGGAALDNEECHLYTKLMRSLGIVYLEHQARI
ncbi:MAG: hypothetical protein AMJ42_04170 [Deltaproteobacteria bacterium DG_8]|nr:MAG: hypothetical protein AMJ42_04170 [Deltaproteobacteria bacterium DG_8]